MCGLWDGESCRFLERRQCLLERRWEKNWDSAVSFAATAAFHQRKDGTTILKRVPSSLDIFFRSASPYVEALKERITFHLCSPSYFGLSPRSLREA